MGSFITASTNNVTIMTRTSGAPHGGPNGMVLIEFGALAEDLTWKLSHFARDVTKFERLGSIRLRSFKNGPVER